MLLKALLSLYQRKSPLLLLCRGPQQNSSRQGRQDPFWRQRHTPGRLGTSLSSRIPGLATRAMSLCQAIRNTYPGSRVCLANISMCEYLLNAKQGQQKVQRVRTHHVYRCPTRAHKQSLPLRTPLGNIMLIYACLEEVSKTLPTRRLCLGKLCPARTDNTWNVQLAPKTKYSLLNQNAFKTKPPVWQGRLIRSFWQGHPVRFFWLGRSTFVFWQHC